MKRGTEFDVDFGELEGFKEAIEKAGKQFPYSAERVLKKEARNIAKDLKVRVNTEAKGHHYKPKNIQKGSKEEKAIIKNRLANSFKPGKVIRHGNKFTTAVVSTAPHYHWYEEGHAMVTHNKKTASGRVKPGTGKVVGEVGGKKTVAKYMRERSEYSELIARELLDEILKDAGL